MFLKKNHEHLIWSILDLLQKKGLIPLSPPDYPPFPPDYPPPVPLNKGKARGINVYLTGGFKEFCKRSILEQNCDKKRTRLTTTSSGDRILTGKANKSQRA
jgi:hypothetical protein